MTGDRQNGFYMVQDREGQWTVGRLRSGDWEVVGSNIANWSEKDFALIGPRIHGVEEGGATSIFTAFVEGAVLSNHHTARGAAVAIADDVQQRLVRNRSTPLTGGEHAHLVDVAFTSGIVNLNQGGSMTKCAIPMERMTQISMLINRSYQVEAVTVLE